MAFLLLQKDDYKEAMASFIQVFILLVIFLDYPFVALVLKMLFMKRCAFFILLNFNYKFVCVNDYDCVRAHNVA